MPGQGKTGRYTKTFLPAWFNKKAGCNLPAFDGAFASPRQTTKPKAWLAKKEPTRHLPKADLHKLIHLHPF